MSSFDHQLDAPQNKKDLWGPFNHLGILWCHGKLSGRKRLARGASFAGIHAWTRGKGYGGTEEFWISAKHQRKAEECWGCRPCFPSIWKKGLIDNIKAQVRRKPGGPGGLEGQGAFPNNFWLLKEDQKKEPRGAIGLSNNFLPQLKKQNLLLDTGPSNFFYIPPPPWLNYRYVKCIKVLRQTNKNKQRNKSGTSLYTVLRQQQNIPYEKIFSSFSPLAISSLVGSIN